MNLGIKFNKPKALTKCVMRSANHAGIGQRKLKLIHMGRYCSNRIRFFFRMEEFEVFVVHEEINLKECRNSNLHAGRAAGLVKHACGDRASGLARRKP
jgi:hypothetical protein